MQGALPRYASEKVNKQVVRVTPKVLQHSPGSKMR